MDEAATSSRMTARTVAAIRETLSGNARRFRPMLFAGPAVIVSIAYVDPGNFATNIQAGARYGYALLWVVLAANIVAMLFQALSAKLGIVTGRNLAQLCRDLYPRPLVWMLWVVSEIAAMATDLAEFLGAAIGLSLLLGCSLLAGMMIAGAATYGLLTVQQRGFRPMEIIIGALVSAIGLCYLVELSVAPVDWGAAASHAFAPSLPDAGALTLSVGIIGATLMPHALYLHSGLTQDRVRARNEDERRKLLRYSNFEVIFALTLAGLVNMAMVIMAASAFHAGHSDVAEIETAWSTLAPLLGPAAAGAFLIALLASGLSSSTVGTMAGQLVMQGFTGFRIPLLARRLITMIPALIFVAWGYNVTNGIVLSQVVLSLALPAPLIPLILMTRNRSLMGEYANGRWTDAGAIVGGAAILALNAVLLAQAFGLSATGLPPQ